MGWLWLGLLIGLLVGAAAVALIVRSVGGITGTDARGVGRLLVDGLAPGRNRDGVAAQRSLARRLRRVGERTASGRRVAADEVDVHVSPEDHEAIASALGIETGQADLTAYYRDLASRSGWIVGREPEVRIVRDISLRPRQAFVRAATRAAPAEPPRAAAPAREAPPPVPPATLDDAVTDVLPRAMLEVPAADVTAVYPAGMLLGDLLVVHGTDVLTVTAATGALRIGRGRHNDLVLDRPGIGRDHLVLESRGDAWWIVPVAGRTAVMGATIDEPRPVASGETLELGRGVRVRLSVEPA